MSSVPGIVQVGKFVTASNKKFSGYVNYIDRSEAQRSNNFNKYNFLNYDGYNKYMGNPLKSSGLFTAENDDLSILQKKELKTLFEMAQDNGSVMWQNVISFDNKFLQEWGIYDSANKRLDEEKLKNAVRDGMTTYLSKAGLSDSAIWSGSIHLNTDNIHVHVATVEPTPTVDEKTVIDESTGEEKTEYRGYIPRKAFNSLKSTVANSLVNRDQSLSRINDLLRNQLPVANGWKNINDRKLLTAYQNIHEQLPVKTSLWKYNNRALDTLRPEIDNMITQYLVEHKSNILNEFNSQLENETLFRQSLYGIGQEGKEFNRANDYMKTKYDQLYVKMGNSLLKEMKKDDWIKDHSSEFKSNNHSPSSTLALNGLKRMFAEAAKEQQKLVKKYNKELDDRLKQNNEERTI